MLETLYYQVLPSGAAVARRIEHRPAPTAADRPYYDVQAIIEEASPGQINVTLYCDNSEFSELEHGDQLYAAVAQQILGKRRSRSATAATSPTSTFPACWMANTGRASSSCATRLRWKNC